MNILIVDDHPTNVSLLSLLIKKIDQAVPIEFTDSRKALEWCRENNPDLVLVDYMMPEMDGLQFIHEFRAIRDKSTIPIIMITADTERNVRHLALQEGATDFLNKPVDKVELTARVQNMLALRKSQLQLTNRANWLAEEVRKATAELVTREREVIYRLSRAAEYRDPETGAHILRMAHYSRHIASNLGLSESEQDLLLAAAPMHDVGKMGIPDHILLKPGRLDPEEAVIMRKHAEFGARILEGSNSILLQTASMIALTHHEKFDGSGYPNGLKGEEIPLFGRIVAVADVFDALTSERPYKKAWSLSGAQDFLRENSGHHFDPLCVDAFFAKWENVLAIRERFMDAQE